MKFFDKADSVDLALVVNDYSRRLDSAIQENIVLKLRLQQHVDRENALLEIIKKDAPNVYEALKKEEGVKNGNND